MSVDPQQLAQMQQMMQQQGQSAGIGQQSAASMPVSPPPGFEDVLQLLFTEIATVMKSPATPDVRAKMLDSLTGSANKLLTGMASFHSAQNQAQGLPPEFQMQMEQQKLGHEQTLSTLQHHHQVEQDKQRLELEQQRLQHDMQLKQAEQEQKLKSTQLKDVLTVQQAEHKDQQHQQDLTLKEDAHQHQQKMAEKQAAQKPKENSGGKK
jgi:hypothetical protein